MPTNDHALSRRAVLLGFSDAVEQLGALEGNQNLNPQLLACLKANPGASGATHCGLREPDALYGRVPQLSSNSKACTTTFSASCARRLAIVRGRVCRRRRADPRRMLSVACVW